MKEKDCAFFYKRFDVLCLKAAASEWAGDCPTICGACRSTFQNL